MLSSNGLEICNININTHFFLEIKQQNDKFIVNVQLETIVLYFEVVNISCVFFTFNYEVSRLFLCKLEA
jgi:hypothetical protein